MKTYTILFLLFFFSLEISAQSNPFTSDVGTLNLLYSTHPNSDKFLFLPQITNTQIENTTRNGPSLMYNTDTNLLNIITNIRRSLTLDNVGNGVATRNLIVPNLFNIKKADGYSLRLNDGTIIEWDTNTSKYVTYKMDFDGIIKIIKGVDTLWTSEWSVQRHKANQNFVTNSWGIRNSAVPDSRNTKLIRMGIRLAPYVFATIIAAKQDTFGNRYILAIQVDGGLHIYNTRGTHDPHHNVAYGTFSYPGRALRDVSDRRVKYVLAPMENVLDRVAKMEIIEYKYKKEVAHLGMTMAPLRIGFIAQDVIQLFPRYTATLSKYSPETNRYTLYYKFFSLLALKSIQDFKTREDKEIYEIKNLIKKTAEKEEVIQLESKIEMFNKKVKDLESKLHSLNKKLGRG